MTARHRHSTVLRQATLLVTLFALASAGGLALAADKNVDLDGKTANGSESNANLTVLATFPVKIRNKVTNKAVGDAFTFAWPSAGPGGFSSSLTAGARSSRYAGGCTTGGRTSPRPARA